MSGEIKYIGGGYLRTASQFTPGLSAVRAVAPVLRETSTFRPGAFRIAGTLKSYGAPNAPISRKVILLERNSMLLVRETLSDASGNYSFESLAKHPPGYMIIGFDYLNNYNAVVADNIQAS